MVSEAGEKGDGVKVPSGGAGVAAAAPSQHQGCFKGTSRAETGEQVLKHREIDGSL